MLVVMYLMTRNLFRVSFEWRRLAQLVAILGGVAVSGELLLPDHGVLGFATRAAWLALVPILLLATHFFAAREREQVRDLVADGRRRVALYRRHHGDVEAYAEDPLRDV